jgi:glutaconate CoA-transferase subunit A
VHQPWAAHPTAVFGRYDYDARHLKLYVEHSRRRDRIGDYIDTYIRATKDHWGYLEEAGGLAHLESLRADPALGY